MCKCTARGWRQPDAALLSDYFRVREYWTGSAVCEWISYGDSGCCLGDNHLAALSAVLCLGYILLKFRDIIPEKDEWKPVEGQYSELLTTGLAMGFMSLVVNFGTIVLQGAINGLGTAIVAAHTAARKVFDIFTVSLYCLGNAMTTFVSQNMGAGEPARIRRGIRHAVVIATGITTVLVIICFAFGRPVFTWLASTDNPTIVDSAVMYSRISIVVFSMCSDRYLFCGAVCRGWGGGNTGVLERC